jgi:rhodanese-related sulfurtransferase
MRLSVKRQSVAANDLGAAIIAPSARDRHKIYFIPTQEIRMSNSVKELLAAANGSVPTISPQDAKALIAHGQVLVVDVRDGPEVQASGKVQGAKHVSRGMLEFRADPDSPYYDKAFDRDKTVIVYCASGGRSALAGKTLKDMGYKDVRNLGGFKGWADSGGAVEKD